MYLFIEKTITLHVLIIAISSFLFSKYHLSSNIFISFVKCCKFGLVTFCSKQLNEYVC